MIGPSSHEDSALASLSRDNEIEEAKVHALLAVASAIEKLADAVEARNSIEENRDL
ncbi:hypothetical protein PSU4_17170 [Pseudonocardia sulfidoxydans NBRC 16205]|uniref:Uncharacterized protein n=2 Tax=Pseudonocardia sulfidoxydans TaxID=54011 RepID=A0A511DEC6_9PSEU|nr:hypothetical protein PSU4_17170 [Pseudonocardia sulfidoxydans NBRC 16205]